MADWVTLRELDRRSGQPKGAAFRAFKRLAPNWREEQDYRVLHPDRDRPEIESLRAGGRIYASSRAVILLAPGPARQISDALTGN